MSDNDKQALLNGTATIQTEIVVHNENLLNIDSYTTTTTNGSFTILDDGFIQFINNTGNPFIVDFDTINANGDTVYTLNTIIKNAGNEKRTYIFEQYDDNNNKLKTDYFRTNKTITTESLTSYFKIRLTTDNTNTQDNFIISIRLEEGTPISLTETNSVIDWNHEDFRQVKEEGWIGQFVARQVTGNLHNLDDDFKITDKELELKLGVRTNDNTNWYSLGNFLVTKVTDDEVNDKTSFEALDYTKKFNKAYEDTIEYPCTALQLAQNVCAQCGVALGSSSFKNDDYVIEGNAFTNNESCRDVMKAIGKLAFSWVRVDWDNKVYIDFDPSPFKNLFDKNNPNVLNAYINAYKVITSSEGDRTVYIPCKPNTTYTITKSLSTPTNKNKFRVSTYSDIPSDGDTGIDYVGYSTGTEVTAITLTTSSTANYLAIFCWNTSSTSTFDEMLDSIQIYEQSSQYNTFGNNKYYNLKTQKEVFGPVDKVVIGYSAIEGERTYIGSEDGTCVINIFDNPLVFNQEQRASIIESASDLLGMTYTPLNTLTVGHPWLKGNELVRVVDMEGVSHDTIPLDRTIQYFGHIKTLINSNVETKTNDNLAYKPEMSKNYERSEIYNDQVKKQIGLIIEEQGNTNNRLNETISTLDGTIQRVSKTETSITDITTTTQSSTGKNSLYLEDAMEGNVLSYSADGASEQDTYSGKNLYNVNDKKDTWNNITSDKDGWITLNINNTDSSTTYRSFYTNVSGNLQTNTDYWVVLEIKGTKSYTGSNSNIDFVSSYTGNEKSQFSIGYRLGINNSSLVNGAVLKQKVTTRSDFTDCLTMTRSIIEIPANSSCTLTFRMSIVKDEPNIDNFIYEPYVGGAPSPNPDYPQEIKNISSKNLINTTTAQKGYYYNVNTISTSNNWYIQQVPVKPNTTYYLSGNNKDNTTAQIWLMDGNKNRLSTIGNYKETHEITTSSTTAYIGISIADYEGTADMNTIRLDELPYNIKVKVTGKNLCDGINKNVWISGSYDVVGIATGNSGLYIPVNSEKYTISTTNTQTRYRVVCTDIEPNSNSNIPAYNGVLYDNTNRTITINTTGHKYLVVNATDLTAIQIESGETATPYEPYKEKEVLIDMSKEDLFTEYEDGYINSSDGTDEAGVGTHRSLYIPVKPNTTYTPSFNVNRVVEYTQDKQFVKNTFNVSNAIKLSATTYYVRLAFGNTVTTDTLDNVTFFESNNSTPYYELCKIGDNKDRLVIDSTGNCVINKKIGKVVLNGSENWILSGTDTFYIEQDGYPSGTHDYLTMSNYYIYSTWDNRTNTDYNTGLYRNGGWSTTRLFIRNKDYTNVNNFKTWLSTHNTDVYYVPATPETITLPNTQIPLFEGINHITLVDDLETNTSVVYYRKTPLSGTYATLTQLNEVSTEKTQEIQTVRQEVLTEITNESLRIDVVRQEIDETGVPILNTGTGYTFDIDGLKMEKTDQDVKSQLDNDGLSVKYKNEDVLTARSNGVNAVNMTVNKFYIQKPIRMEKTKSISDSTQTGLGFFYIGE